MTTLTSTTLALTLGLLPCVFFANIATAKSDHSDHETSSKSVKPTKAEKSDDNSDDDTSGAKRLNGNRLRACQRKQPEITSTMQHISTQGTNQLAVFHDIAEHTKRFYAENGYSAPGYAELVAETDALYSTATSSVTSLKNLGDNWSCADNAPRQGVSIFRDAKIAEVAAVQAYKDKVHALILLVKTAAQEKH